MKKLLIIALSLYALQANAQGWEFSISAELGRCQTSVYIQMCDDNRPVWKVSAEASKQLSKHLSFVSSLDHFSSWDGKADITGDVDKQSGVFNYVGTGLRWKF